MRDDDWYRRTTWTADDARHFESKLARSRSSRAQYLKIQAGMLAATGDPALAVPAIELANRYLQEDPDGFFAVEACLILAGAHSSLKDEPRILDAYRRAVAFEKSRRGPRCMAYVEFAWFAATRDLRSVFEEVLAAIDANMEEGDLVFPITQYKYFGALALISAGLGDAENARRMARNATSAAARARGPFPGHPKLGLVGNRGEDARVRQHIERLAR
jgi:hypothetical protein